VPVRPRPASAGQFNAPYAARRYSSRTGAPTSAESSGSVEQIKLSFRAYCTVMVPVMNGWMEQWYFTVPAVLKVWV
jgi:hypothetical protein